MTKVFSGIRPSGKLHLGNYLGAIKNWMELQDKASTDGGRAIFAVVDYHGITTPYDPKTYQQQITDVVLDYLAAGVNPDKALLIRQSKVPQHTELAWIFNTITPVGWLDRLPTYKEKQDQIEESGNSKAASWKNNMGILDYPVLMAADILIYKSNLVPIGDDQKAHLDVTNEIAKKFNFMFGETFEPVKTFKSEGERIKSLQDPRKKMSKTGDEGIALSDEPDTIRAMIKKATTDSGKEVAFNPDSKPAISNLITIYHLLSGKNIKQIEEIYGGKTYVDFKADLGEIIVDFLKPFQKKYKELKENPDYVLSILTKSEEKARELASATLNDVKKKMGLE
ncbi:MAG: tryptophan--tRNA ligase [Candidatus Yanofskybacteria bacterium]|nr:tryptophan--tRNA ligase [Candidatus Yanofskybacteria bacterium]